MKKYTLFVLTILLAFNSTVFSYNAEIDNMYHLFYSLEDRDNTKIYDAIEKVESLNGTRIEKQAYKNLVVNLRVTLDNGSKKENKKLIEDTLKENEPQLSNTDANYMVSLASLMIVAMPYMSLNEVIKLGGKIEDLYDNAIMIDDKSFSSMFGKATSVAFKPSFVGGGVKKAMPFFQKAVLNAKKDYEKYLAYIWISQAYLKLKDKDNYNIYFNKAVDIFPNGVFTKKLEEINRKNKSLFK